jgi:hypothetical protein
LGNVRRLFSSWRVLWRRFHRAAATRFGRGCPAVKPAGFIPFTVGQ